MVFYKLSEARRVLLLRADSVRILDFIVKTAVKANSAPGLRDGECRITAGRFGILLQQ